MSRGQLPSRLVPGSVPPGVGWSSRTSDAPPISTGAATSNVRAGVSSRMAAPAAPPSATTRPSRRSRAAWPASSGREPAAAPTPVKHSDTVLVTLAASGGSPSASSTG